MKVILYSNKGAVREHNEDALLVSGNIISGSSMPKPLELYIESSYKCFIVIDGMGGYEGGEQAARIITASFIDNINILNLNISVEDGKKRVRYILEKAVQNIANIVVNKPELSSMGAALAGVFCFKDKILAFNCGDCRVYRQHGEYLERLSHDHSIVQELVDRGEIDEDAMRTHPRKNTITACVSANITDLDVYYRELPLQTGEKFFICSDGVWEALSIDELESCFKNSPSCLESANDLSEKLILLQDRCHDNISFLIFEF